MVEGFGIWTFFPDFSCSAGSIDPLIPLQYCPALEHLVLRPGSHFTPLHPTVKWIDVWRTKHFNDKQKYIALRQTLTRAAFPALKNIRQLDSELLPTIDWPLLFPPDQHVDGSGIEYQYPGIHILVTAERITKQDMAYFASSECEDEPDQSTESDDSRDDDYLPPSNVGEDDTSDHSSWSSDNDKDRVTDDDSEEGDWANVDTSDRSSWISDNDTDGVTDDDSEGD